MTEQPAQGRFLWCELMADDAEAAKGFYSRVTGWQTQPFEGGPVPYWIWMAGEMPAGGLMELPEDARSRGAPPHWMSYIYSDDIDGVCEKAKSLGGEIIFPPADIPTVGRLAVLHDPEGAVFGIMHPLDPPGPQPEKTPNGHMAWAELAISDPEAAFSFYSALFGWQETDSMDMGDAGIYQMFGPSAGVTVGGLYTKPAEMPASCWLYYFTVADLDEAVGTVKSLGGQVLNGPMEVPGGERVAQCLDPQGAGFALHSYT